MTELYESLERTPEGARDLADARLRHDLLAALYVSMEHAGVTQVELARRLGVRKSAVNQVLRGDGNLRMTTAAHYLAALGLELGVTLYPLGEQRRAAMANRDPEKSDLNRPQTRAEVPEPLGRRRYAVTATSEISPRVDVHASPAGGGRWWLFGLIGRGSSHHDAPAAGS